MKHEHIVSRQQKVVEHQAQDSHTDDISLSEIDSTALFICELVMHLRHVQVCLGSHEVYQDQIEDYPPAFKHDICDLYRSQAVVLPLSRQVIAIAFQYKSRCGHQEETYNKGPFLAFYLSDFGSSLIRIFG